MSRALIALVLCGLAFLVATVFAIAELREANRTINRLIGKNTELRETANGWREYAEEAQDALAQQVLRNIDSPSEDAVLERNQQNLSDEQRRELDDEFGLVVLDLALQQITEGDRP